MQNLWQFLPVNLSLLRLVRPSAFPTMRPTMVCRPTTAKNAPSHAVRWRARSVVSIATSEGNLRTQLGPVRRLFQDETAPGPGRLADPAWTRSLMHGCNSSAGQRCSHLGCRWHLSFTATRLNQATACRPKAGEASNASTAERKDASIRSLAMCP